MSDTSDINIIIRNGTFNQFISEKSKNIQDYDSRIRINWLVQLSQALSDEDLKNRVNVDDVLKATKIFGDRLQLNQSYVNNYLKANIVLSNYFKTVKNDEARIFLSSVMTLSKPPLLKISGQMQLNLYCKYLDGILLSEFPSSEALIDNIILSVNEFVKSHEQTYIQTKYLEGLLERINYYIRKLQKSAPSKMKLCHFLQRFFEILFGFSNESCKISEKSYKLILTILLVHTEICIDNKFDLTIIKILSKMLRDIDDKGSWSIVTKLHACFYRDEFDDDLAHIINKTDDKNYYNITVLNYISKALYRYYHVKYEVIKPHTAYKLFIVLQILIKKCTNTNNCPPCNTDTHLFLNLQHASGALISKLIQKEFKKPSSDLTRFFPKYVASMEKTRHKCPQHVFHVQKCVTAFYKALSQIVKLNGMKLPAEYAPFVQDTLLIYLKTFAKNSILPGECVNEFKYFFKILSNAYCDIKDFTKACYFLLIGSHFTKSMQFAKIFKIRHDNSDFTSSCYEILTQSAIAKHYNISLEKNDYINLLLMELKGFNELWRSKLRMREAAKNIKLISDDPITRAKACSFLRIITSEDLPLINSTLEELESNLKYFKGKSKTLAHALLGNLYAMQYLALGNEYANEIAKTPSLVNQTPEESDRDGLKHTNEVCDINPIDDNKLNLEKENSIVEQLIQGMKYWGEAVKNYDTISDDEELKIYFESALELMEMAIISLSERGSYGYHKYDLVLLGFQLAKNLENHLMALRCVSRLLGSMSYNKEIDSIVTECNSYAAKLLKSNLEEKNKLYLYDFMLSYTEYLWNSKDEDKAIVLGLGTIARIKKDKISDNLLISRMYWIEALLKTNNNSSWKSILSLHGLINDELLVAMQDKDATTYCFNIKVSVFINLALKIGKYSMHICQLRLVNFYLKQMLKLLQKLGLTHRIADVLCILLRTDIVKEKYADAQVKINVLNNITNQSQLSESSKSGSKSKKVVEHVKKMFTSPTRGTKQLINIEAYRDSSMLSPEPPKLIRMADNGSPPLVHQSSQLPDFFNHDCDCKCISCYGKSRFGLMLTVNSLEARLNCFLGNTNVTKRLFSVCNKIRAIAKSKFFKGKHMFQEDNDFKTYECYHFYDQCLYTVKYGKYDMILSSMDPEKSLLLQDVAFNNLEFVQEFITLLLSFIFTKYLEKSNCYLSDIVTDENIKLTPQKIFNELAFKTPAATKAIVGGRLGKKTKFKIHQDVSPVNLNIPKICLNVVDCEENDKRVKVKTDLATPIETRIKNKSDSILSKPKQPVQLHESRAKSTSKTNVKTQNLESSKKFAKTPNKLHMKENLSANDDDKVPFPVLCKTPAPKTACKNSNLLSSPTIILSDDEVFETPMKFTQTPTVAKTTKVSMYKKAILSNQDSSSSLDEVFTKTPNKISKAKTKPSSSKNNLLDEHEDDLKNDKNMQKTMHKRKFKRICQPFVDSGSSVDDDVFLPCSDENSWTKINCATPDNKCDDKFYTPVGSTMKSKATIEKKDLDGEKDQKVSSEKNKQTTSVRQRRRNPPKNPYIF